MDKLKASDVIKIDDEFIEQVADKLRAKAPEVVYTLKELAKMPGIKVNEATLRTHAKNYAAGETHKRHLVATKKGKSWYVKEKDLEKYLK